MKKRSDTLHLLILFWGIALSVFFFMYFKNHETAQIWTALTGCAYYVLWGIMHHASRERLNKLIVMEYILLGGLTFLLFLLALIF
jgi:hypothetical protein